jgi:AhpC/TSA family
VRIPYGPWYSQHLRLWLEGARFRPQRHRRENLFARRHTRAKRHARCLHLQSLPVKAAIGRIVEEAKALRAIGIGTIAIMPNDTEAYPEDSLDNMKTFAARHGFVFPYVIDTTQEVARAYDAQCTPDFFGFNMKDELQYRGRLDASRTSLVANARRDLFEAMKRVAETGHGPEQQMPSMGCSIKWKH